MLAVFHKHEESWTNQDDSWIQITPLIPLNQSEFHGMSAKGIVAVSHLETPAEN